MAPLTLQIMSDLHLETPSTRPSYESFTFAPRSSNLALLGDIGHALDDRLYGFLRYQLAHFERVFFVMGNHEAYGTSVSDAARRLREFQGAITTERQTRTQHGTVEIGEFVFLDRDRYDLDESNVLLGCTLYSRILPEQTQSVARFVTDFSATTDWNVEAHNEAHARDLEWLNTSLKQIEHESLRKTVAILTHFSPTVSAQANDENHITDASGVLSAFTTDLRAELCWKSDSTRIWAFGHTHFCCNYVDDSSGKMIIANQKGYRRNENMAFDSEKVVDLQEMSADSSNTLDKCASKSGRKQDLQAKRTTSSRGEKKPKCMIQ